MKRIIVITFSVVFLLGIGVFIGLVAGEKYDPYNIILGKDLASKEIRAPGYKLISPLLECDQDATSIQINGLDPLRSKLEKKIGDMKGKGMVADVSVYFRDLNNGPWFGVNERANFAPASLLKLPLLLAYYKQAEKDPSILQKEFKFDGGFDTLPQNYAKATLIKGEKYTVKDLLERMIVSSDNDALVLLSNNIGKDEANIIQKDLGVEVSTSDDPTANFITVRGYASLFRILFNASYLSRDYSEQALDLLTGSEFKKGLVAGVPSDVVVAHKYGERVIGDINQLHDCGILYYPHHPYLLCVMTRGNDYDKIATVIRDISKTVYDDLEKRYESN